MAAERNSADPTQRRSPTLDERVTLQKLEVLCAVVELGTVTAVARDLHVAQPVITAHLRSLEERIGVRIFEREGRFLRLTAEGVRVHAWALATLEGASRMLEAVERVRAGEMGSVRVGASMSLGTYRLPTILAGFRGGSSDIEVSLFTGSSASTIRGVDREQFDLGVVILASPPLDTSLRYEPIGEEQFVLLTSRDGKPSVDWISLRDLHRHALVIPPAGSLQRELLDAAFVTHGAVRPRGVIEFGHPEAIKAAVRGGAGAAVLFECSAAAELSSGEFRRIEIAEGSIRFPVFAVTRRDRVPSRLQRRLQDEIAAALSRYSCPNSNQ